MELAMSNVIPMDPKKRIEASLQPASPSEAQAAVAMLAKALPIMPSIQDPQAFKGIMAEFLAAYPADVLIAAVDQAVQKFKHMPSTAEMIELCKGLVYPRREALNRLERIEYENQHEAERRRTERAAAAEREAAEEARRQATIRWLRGIEERARERLGDAAPLPGDVAFAYSIFEVSGQPLGKIRLVARGAEGRRALGGTVLPANGPRRANKASDPARADCLGRVLSNCQAHQSRRSGREIRG
jgi:hypothetical protein